MAQSMPDNIGITSAWYNAAMASSTITMRSSLRLSMTDFLYCRSRFLNPRSDAASATDSCRTQAKMAMVYASPSRNIAMYWGNKLLSVITPSSGATYVTPQMKNLAAPIIGAQMGSTMEGMVIMSRVFPKKLEINDKTAASRAPAVLVAAGAPDWPAMVSAPMNSIMER